MLSKKEIVFIESGPTDSFTKIPNILKKIGYKTVLITIMSSTDSQFLKESYDKIISFHFKFFRTSSKSIPKIVLYAIKKIPLILKSSLEIIRLKPKIVVARSTPNWLCFFFMKYFKNSVFIYLPYDIRSHCFKNFNEVDREGVPRLEIKAEKYCFRDADGIIHKGRENEMKLLNKNLLDPNLIISCPIIRFLPYCSKDLIVPYNNKKVSKKDGNIHIVYTGNISTGESCMDTTETLLKQKIHLHFYGKIAYLSEKESYSLFGNEYSKFFKNQYFHLHKPVEQKKLASEISKYDYGMWSYDLTNNALNASSTGNKFFTYLEAGLPIIHFNNYEAFTNDMNKYKIGISRNTGDIKNLRKILEKNRPEKFIKNILKAREELCMENQIPRLLKFFQEAENYHHQKNKK